MSEELISQSKFSKFFIVSYILKLSIIMILLIGLLFLIQSSELKPDNKRGVILLVILSSILFLYLIYRFYRTHYKNIQLYKNYFIVQYKGFPSMKIDYLAIHRLYYTRDSYEGRRATFGESVFNIELNIDNTLVICESEWSNYHEFTELFIHVVKNARKESYVESIHSQPRG